MDAADRQAVTDAANQIDAQLEADPYSTSEGRWGATRVMFEPPLAILFEVAKPNQFVDVLKVWRIPG
jgi:hypothetical protein